MICRIVYVDEKDAFGQDRLVPMQPSLSSAVASRAPDPTIVAPSPSSPALESKGKGKAYPEIPLQPVCRREFVPDSGGFLPAILQEVAAAPQSAVCIVPTS